ncbi:MAG: sugar ABC transporter permease [Clostridiaceae bacterium]|nr:sugar ABC transporter permease [Clostridiaceae bacterium]
MVRKYVLNGRSYETAQTVAAAVFLLPTIVTMIFLFVLPVIQVITMSFTNWNLATGVRNYIGLKNFEYLFTDKTFGKAIVNTFTYSAFKLSLDLVLSLFIAVLLDSYIPLKRMLRTIYFAPVVVPIVASSLIWIWFYDPGIGPFNQILTFFGLPKLQWLYHENTALLSIGLFSVWKGLGYNIVLFLAGLQNIPDSYMEAAYIDGANSKQAFFRVKLPLLSPIASFVIMMGIINSFKVFTEINVMTPGGGPLNSTMLLVVYVYQQAFTNGRMGRGSAAALILFAIVFILTVLQKNISRKTVHYE